MRHLVLLFGVLLACPAWAVEFAIVDGVANTSTGNTDYIKTGFGVPACAMVFATYGTANGTAVSHGGVAIGATDGTTQVSLMGASEDNVATTDTGGAQNTTDTFRMVTQTGQSITDGTASGSLITDGLRLNTTDAFAAAYRVKVLLIGGSGVLSCKVGSITTSGTNNTAVTVTPGFQSDLILFWGLSDSSSAPNANGLSIGAYVRASNSQASLSMSDNTAQATSVVEQHLTTDRVMKRVVNGPTGAEVEAGNVTATQFDVTTRSTGVSVDLQYLAIDFDSSLEASIVTDVSATSTGNEAITGAGFKPQFALGMYGSVLVNDTQYTDGDAEAWGLGLITAAAQACVGMATDDNVSPSNTNSLTDSLPLCLWKDDALFQAASFVSFDADGMTINNTAANGTSRQRIFVFVKESAATKRQRPMLVYP